MSKTVLNRKLFWIENLVQISYFVKISGFFDILEKCTVHCSGSRCYFGAASHSSAELRRRTVTIGR